LGSKVDKQLFSIITQQEVLTNNRCSIDTLKFGNAEPWNTTLPDIAIDVTEEAANV
jgi:hypothetical protein